VDTWWPPASSTVTVKLARFPPGSVN
jgi:hypothetical protein